MAQALTLSLRSYDAQTLRHSHPFHQIVLPVEGTLEMEVGGKGGRVAGCQAALIAAGETHGCEASGRNSFVVLDWTAGDDNDGGLSRLSARAEREPFLAYDAGLQHLVDFLGFELNRRPQALARDRRWGEVLLAALSERTGDPKAAAPRQLSRAIAFIRAQHRRPLTVAEIAAGACCSASHLHALFQRCLQTSPMEFLQQVRLDRAMRLLGESDAAIGAIAFETGHADQSVLTRSMRRRRNITPAAYRRRLRAARP
jgi:AraC-like DNA-binding protein